MPTFTSCKTDWRMAGWTNTRLIAYIHLLLKWIKNLVAKFATPDNQTTVCPAVPKWISLTTYLHNDWLHISTMTDYISSQWLTTYLHDDRPHISTMTDYVLHISTMTDYISPQWLTTWSPQWPTTYNHNDRRHIHMLLIKLVPLLLWSVTNFVKKMKRTVWEAEPNKLFYLWSSGSKPWLLQMTNTQKP